jgi:hypothetical protein
MDTILKENQNELRMNHHGKKLSSIYSCMKMEKWDMLKLFQEWKQEGIKENDGGGESNYDLFCKCHDVPPVQQ